MNCLLELLQFLKFTCSTKIDTFLGTEIPKWLVVYSKGAREHDHKLKVGISSTRLMLSDRMNSCFIPHVFHISTQ